MRVTRLVVAALGAAFLATGGVVGTAGVGDASQACGTRSAAVVVVDTGSGVHQTVICFDGSVTGIDALQLAGAQPTTYAFSGQGAAVCSLYGVGNPADQSCLIGPGGAYWAYYRAAPGATGWTYSRGGASGATVTDGSVEGWRYGTGAAPPFVSFCSAAGCPPPPTAAPVDGGSGGTGTAGGSGGATGAAGVASGTGAGGSQPATATPGSGPSTTTAPGGPVATSAPDKPSATGDSTTADPNGRTAGRGRRTGSVELAAGGPGGGDGTGSPVGVAVAAGVLLAVALGAVWLRRRRHPVGPG